MTAYKIEKNISIPAKGYSRPSVLGQCASKMVVGDSVHVDTKQEANNLRSRLRIRGFSCTQRKQKDGTFRVWAVKKNER